MAATGFGHGAFGQGPFGEARWGYEAFWRSLPEAHRRYDAANGDALFKLVMAFADTSDLLRRQAKDLPDQRDPRRVQTRFDYNVTITIDASITAVSQADSSDHRAYLELIVTSGDITRVAPGWSLLADNRTYRVRGVRKAEADTGVEGVIEVYGDEDPSGTLVLQPPSIISFLGKDFAVEVDGNEPEFFQRSTVYDAVKWYNQKGTELGLTLRASVAGFDATIRGLFSIQADASDSLGAERVFEIPEGSGNWYTDIAPLFGQFDDVPADIFPLDFLCSVDDVTVGEVLVNSVFEGGIGAYTAATSLRTDASTTAILAQAGNGVNWYLEDANGVKWFAEDISGLDFILSIEDLGQTVNTDAAPVGENYTLGYRCAEQLSCAWCRSHKVRIELVIVDATLLSDSAALEGAFDRLLRKLDELIPAHVSIVQIILDETSSATITLTATSLAETWTFDLFDDIPADDQPVDEYTVTFQ